MIRNRKAEVNETRPINTISEEEWIAHFRGTYDDGGDNTENSNNQPRVDKEYDSEITKEDLRKVVSELENRKTPGMDGIANEMLKYG